MWKEYYRSRSVKKKVDVQRKIIHLKSVSWVRNYLYIVFTTSLTDEYIDAYNKKRGAQKDILAFQVVHSLVRWIYL